MIKIAVIAGTPVDTRMGAGLLKKKGARALGFPVSQTPEEQTIFQTGPQTARERAVGAILDRIRAQGLERVLLYCNSLSATIDARALAEPRGLRIWTPMDVYGEIARTYRRVGVLAANCQGAAGVERAMVNASPEILVLGAANLALVQGVEAGTPPEELAEARAKEAFFRLKTRYPRVCLVHLYALEGAVRGMDFNALPQEVKADLKEFSDLLKGKGGASS